MKVQLPLLAYCLFALVMTFSLLEANPLKISFASKRAISVEGQQIDKKLWAKPQTKFMMNKTFPIDQWNKHFSSLGSKRAPISLSEDKDKQLFKTKLLDQKMISFEMSRWNEQLRDLHKKACIKMDNKARLVADQRLYYMTLQDSQKYSSMADELSLRDLNRYQFRRNRSNDDIPIEKVGLRQ